MQVTTIILRFKKAWCRTFCNRCWKFFHRWKQKWIVFFISKPGEIDFMIRECFQQLFGMLHANRWICLSQSQCCTVNDRCRAKGSSRTRPEWPTIIILCSHISAFRSLLSEWFESRKWRWLMGAHRRSLWCKFEADGFWYFNTMTQCDLFSRKYGYMPGNVWLCSQQKNISM